MNALTVEFLSDGFQVLGFPCNNFYLQEPGNTASEILGGLAAVRPGDGYRPAFQMFKKIDVNGENEHKMYTYLKSMCGPTSDVFQDGLYYDPKKVSDVRWNFEIFLINKLGVPVYRYSPDHDVMSIKPDIRALINTPIETILREDNDEGKEHVEEIAVAPIEEVPSPKEKEVEVPKAEEIPVEAVKEEKAEETPIEAVKEEKPEELVDIIDAKEPEVEQ